jgi:hypothetical protein
MKKPSSFYVVYPSNQHLRNLLNALKLIADESQRTEAHITVRGPYVKKLSKNDVKKFSTIISNEVLNISKVDNFFAFNQNTVFFSCDENENLKAIWKKITYNDFKPHITIYDGDNRDFAIKLFKILASNFKPFKYRVSDLSWLEPKSNDELKLYSLKSISDYNSVLENILNIPKKDIDFPKLTQIRRLNKISKIAERLFADGF